MMKVNVKKFIYLNYGRKNEKVNDRRSKPEKKFRFEWESNP